ncbi:oligosaccharide flippase family protein [Ideonella sp. DXS22W]|uniref:Oligosaccharide flippase family protein n=1 Tax=Pseudaquabacterium inlustre TaxID=2984192 RepID=A0ABU9CE16_9BURK
MQESPYSAKRLRRAGLYFAVGRVVTALLTLVVFATVARRLALPDYGVYTLGLSVVELGIGLGAFGLDALMGRLLPEYRVAASGVATSRLLAALASAQLAGIALGAVLLWGLASLIASWMAAPALAEHLPAFALVLVLEGLARIMRDQVLAGLLRQGEAQVVQLIRLVVMLGLLAAHPGAGLADVVRYELTAAGSAAAVALALAAWHLRQQHRRPAARADWTRPTWRAARHLAGYSYLNSVLWLVYSPHVITLVVSRYAGVDAAALFGFARGLSEQIRRYLPAEFFIGLIRPALVARYVQEHSVSQLMQRVHLILKLSLLALMPIVAYAAALGEALCAALSKGRMAAAGPVLLLLLVQHVPGSNRRFIDVVANIVSRADICVRAGLPLLFTPLAIAVVLRWQPVHGAWLAAAVMVAAELAYSLSAGVLFRRNGVAFTSLPPVSLARLAGYGVLTYGVLRWLPFPTQWAPPVPLAIGAVVALLVTATAAWLLPILSSAEADQFKRLLKSR